MALDHSARDVGLDQVLPVSWPRSVEPVGWPDRSTSTLRNLLLDLSLRLGILGAAVVARLGPRSRGTRAASDRGLAIGAASALAAGLVLGVVDNGFFYRI